MLTPRENFLETIRKGGHPECLPNGFSALRSIPADPLFKYTRANRIKGTTTKDRWGTVIKYPVYVPAAMPFVTPENQVIKDIEHWQDYVNVPDIEAACRGGWGDSIAARDRIDSARYLSMSNIGTGIFEQLHMLMTFENALANLLLHPQPMHELVETIKEYRMTYLRLIVEHLHPDVILSHDDWGTHDTLFFSPEIWREFFKEPYRELYGYLHGEGVIVMHHSDSYLQPLAAELADIGVDVWQGVIVTNDIPKISAALDGRMALMGGIDSIIDRADATEEEVRAEARRCCADYGSLGHFIPSMTYGARGTIFPDVEPLVADEIARYNMETYGVSII